MHIEMINAMNTMDDSMLLGRLYSIGTALIAPSKINEEIAKGNGTLDSWLSHNAAIRDERKTILDIITLRNSEA